MLPFLLRIQTMGNASVWYIEPSFLARLATYVLILVAIMVTIVVIFKFMIGICRQETRREDDDEPDIESERNPLMEKSKPPFSYGTMEESPEPGFYESSSTEIYDGKICVICYDHRRNCFFVPCGHSASCHACAQKIVREENKLCPVCRRYIHKVRRLLNV